MSIHSITHPLAALAITLVFLSLYVGQVEAAIFDPGETLDPSCFPSDASCRVKSPVFSLDDVVSASTFTATSTAGTSVFNGLLRVLQGITLSPSATTTTNTLQNRNNTLYWNGSALGSVFTRVAESDDISASAYTGKSFSIAGEDTSPQGIALSADGTALFIVGTQNSRVFQYTLSTPYDVSTATSSGKSFSVAAQETFPYGLAFSADGTALFVAGFDSNSIFQYTLSTPYDVSTATFSGKSVDIHEDHGLFHLAFNPAGTRMFVYADHGRTLYQYTLSTPYDVSTASFVNKDFSFNGVINPDPKGFAFTADGTTLFVADSSLDVVQQYTLSTPYDLATVSYANKRVSIAGEDATPSGIVFNPESTIMFVVGGQTNRVYQYTSEYIHYATGNVAIGTTTASTTLFVDGGSYFTDTSTFASSLVLSSSTPSATTSALYNQGGTLYWNGSEIGGSLTGNEGYSLTFNSNGTAVATSTLFFATTSTAVGIGTSTTPHTLTVDGNIGLTASNYLNWSDISGSAGYGLRDNAGTLQYKNSGDVWDDVGGPFTRVSEKGFDLSTATTTGKTYNFSSQIDAVRGISFSNDGRIMHLHDSQIGKYTVHQYTLTEPFDVTTASYSGKNLDMSGQGSASNIKFSTDGTKLFATNVSNDTVRQYDLDQPFDISTASYNNKQIAVGTLATNPTNLDFSIDGDKMFLLDFNGGGFIHEFILSTPFEILTASSTGVHMPLSGIVLGPIDLDFSSDGTKMIVQGNSFQLLHEFSLTTGFDITTATSTGVTFDYSAQHATPVTFRFNPAGSKLFIPDRGGFVHQYSLDSIPETVNYINGNVALGTTTASTTFFVQGDSYFTSTSTFAGVTYTGDILPHTTNTHALGSTALRFDCVYYDSTVLGTCASDARLKENIADITFGSSTPLAQVAGLKLRSFTYTDDPEGQTTYGLVAQELLEVSPHLVIEDDAGFYQVDYGKLQYLMLAGVRDMARLIFGSSTATSTLAASAMFPEGIAPALASLAGMGTTTTHGDDATFLERFLARMTTWLGDTKNGVTKLFAREVYAEKICVATSAGEPVCITGDELKSVMAATTTSPTTNADTNDDRDDDSDTKATDTDDGPADTTAASTTTEGVPTATTTEAINDESADSASTTPADDSEPAEPDTEEDTAPPDIIEAGGNGEADTTDTAGKAGDPPQEAATDTSSTETAVDASLAATEPPAEPVVVDTIPDDTPEDTSNDEVVE